ncbi:MAG: hypothetical protein ACLPKT_23945 [Methylocella sp.]
MTIILDEQSGSKDDAAPLLPKFVRFDDLRASGITDNWTHLTRLIDVEGFPPGRLISANLRAWTVDEVQAWLASRPVARKKVTLPPSRRTKRKEAAAAEGAQHAETTA